MTAITLPDRDLLAVNPSTGQFKTAIGQFYDFVAQANPDNGATVWLQRSTAYNLYDIVYVSTANMKYYLVCTNAGTTGSSDIDISSLNVGDTITDGTAVWQLETTASSIQVAAAPSYYRRQKLMTVEPISVTVYPTWVNIGTRGFVSDTSVTLELSTSSSWDNSTYITAANRAGKDFYIYACQQSTSIPKFILSANSTVPTGCTATNSRKIGGFHCLCKSVGTISGHTLNGYVTGNIIPASIWDLLHRPASTPEGMVYVAGINKWVDIYLTSTSITSAYGGIIADGASSPVFHWYKFVEQIGAKNKHLPTQMEFMILADGSNQNTNINTSADPNTTGGHVDTNGRRMISNYGIEDCCGCEWQWGNEPYDVGGTWNWRDKCYDASADSERKGMTYSLSDEWGIRRVILGGGWGDGSHCGSRCSAWYNSPVNLVSAVGCRAVSEPLDFIS